MNHCDGCKICSVKYVSYTPTLYCDLFEEKVSDNIIARCKKYSLKGITPLRHRTLAIDFDNVIHKYSKGDVTFDELLPNAKEALLELSEKFDIVIFTVRADNASVQKYIEEKIGLTIRVTNVKPDAVAYIDDKAIRFTSWEETLKLIKEYVPEGYEVK